MPKFEVSVEWSGYSRGYSVFEVEAEDAEEAKEIWYDGKKVHHEIHRDDTEKEAVDVKEIT